MSKIKVNRSQTSGETPTTTTGLDLGEISVNIPDRKIFIRDGSGAAVLVADRIADYNAANLYAVGDFCIESNIMYRCTTEITVPEPFDPAKWVELGGTGVAVILNPTAAGRNTIDLTGEPAVEGLVIQGDPAQTADLFAVPGTQTGDSSGSVINALGFPEGHFAPSTKRIAQPTHPFSAVGQAVQYTAGPGFGLADGADPATVVVGIVAQVIDANTFVMRFSGEQEGLQPTAFAGGTIADGTQYYLSDAVLGQLTATAPAAAPNPVLRTTGATKGILTIGEGIGGAFVRTAGDTMVGPLRMDGATSIEFTDADTEIRRSASTVEIEVEIDGAVANILSTDDDAAANPQTVMTRRKADARHLQLDGSAPMTGSLTIDSNQPQIFLTDADGTLVPVTARIDHNGGVLKIDLRDATNVAVADVLRVVYDDTGVISHEFDIQAGVAGVIDYDLADPTTVPSDKTLLTREAADARYSGAGQLGAVAYGSTNADGTVTDLVGLTVTKGAVGRYTYTFDTPLADNRYHVSFMSEGPAGTTNVGHSASIAAGTKLDTGFELYVQGSQGEDEDHTIVVWKFP